MSNITPAGSSGAVASVSISGATAATTATLAMTIANDEYDFTFPTNTKFFVIKLREGSVDLKIGYTAGATAGTDYFTVPRGNFHSIDGLTLTSSLTIYVSTTVAAQILEIEYWI